MKTISNPPGQISVIRGTVCVALTAVETTNSAAEAVKPADTSAPIQEASSELNRPQTGTQGNLIPFLQSSRSRPTDPRLLLGNDELGSL